MVVSFLFVLLLGSNSHYYLRVVNTDLSNFREIYLQLTKKKPASGNSHKNTRLPWNYGTSLPIIIFLAATNRSTSLAILWPKEGNILADFGDKERRKR